MEPEPVKARASAATASTRLYSYPALFTKKPFWIEIANQCDFLNKRSPCLRPAAGRENIDAMSLVTIATSSPFRWTLPHHFSKSRASSGKTCLYCSGGHSEDLCGFTNTQATNIAQMEGCTQNRR